ncbi:MAG: signal peptidase I [Propionibacteriales bacterium]|nr:signal peptidase I [Propionibacteriales bacterium]
MPQRRSAGRVLADGLLTLAAAGGVVCILLVIAAFALDITLIMFRTGSMSPTIPAGSLAVVQRVPAASVAVGDVVTVERTGMLPVTHRVTSVQPSGDRAVLTMRGDANDTDDPAPYTVETVRKVLWSMPGLARLVQWFSNPYMLGGITIGASLLVTWAFWPRDGGGRGGGTGRAAPTSDRVLATTGTGPRRALRSAIPAGSVVFGVLLAASLAPAAQAATQREVISGEHLTLTSITDDQMTSMQPDTWATWQVGVTAEAPDPGTVGLSLSASGTMPLDVQITSCSVAWRRDRCLGDARVLRRTDQVTLGGPEQALTSFPSDQQRWLLIKVRLAEGADSGRTTLVVHARGAGDDLSIGGGDVGTLSDTGSPFGPGLLGLAVLAVGSGIGLAALGRRRR